MKVILLENIKKLGKKYEVVEVADGYARNYLLPEEKAEMATEKNLNKLEQLKKREEIEVKKEKSEIEDLISQIEGKEFVIKMKVGEKDQLFEAVTAEKISEKLKEEGFEIDPQSINLEAPIKKLAEEEVGLEFDYDLSSNIKIKIEKE